MVGDDGDRLMVACVECDSVYAARRLEDGSLLPIGKPQGCDCGSTGFTELAEEAVLEFDEGKGGLTD